jgi:phosphoglycolate phosphatase
MGSADTPADSWISRFRLVVFDLDGTLVDSRRDLAESANEVLESCGGAPHSEKAIGQMVGDGAAMLVARAFAAAGCSQPPDALDRFLAVYNARLLRFTVPYPGVPELLAWLTHRATLCVLTNKPLGAARSILDGLELSHFFGDRVIGGDGPFPRKPDPSGLLALMRASAVSASSTLLVGDSAIDWRTAQAAGVPACLVQYGFGLGERPVELRGIDRIVDDPYTLMTIL